jgi:ADP-ribose pyrophosphatase YjhB (NUDIX family)
MVAGSILPIAFHRGKLIFLFGKENPLEDSAKGWSDFGGGVEDKDSPLETAIRECSEELTGFLGNPSQIKRLVDKQTPGVYKLSHNDYHVHIVLMPEYDPMLPVYYNNNHSFLWNRMDKKLLNSTRLFEKIEVRWFTENDLVAKRAQFRNFYRHIVDLVRDNIPNIKRHFSKHATSKHATSKHETSNHETSKLATSKHATSKRATSKHATRKMYSKKRHTRRH